MLPFYHFEWSPLSSIRMGRYKYIEAPKPELYDTVSDPGEKRDLSGANRAMASQLKALLGQDLARYSARNAAAVVPRDADPATVEKAGVPRVPGAQQGIRRPPGPGSNLPDPKDRIDLYELINAGTLAARSGDYGRATKLLNQALQRDPASLVAHFQLGVVCRVTGALDQAEQEFLKDAGIAARATIWRCGGWPRSISRAGGTKRPRAPTRNYCAQSPNDYLAHFSLGGLYVTVDRWDDALAAFRKAHSIEFQRIRWSRS